MKKQVDEYKHGNVLQVINTNIMCVEIVDNNLQFATNIYPVAQKFLKENMC